MLNKSFYPRKAELATHTPSSDHTKFRKKEQMKHRINNWFISAVFECKELFNLANLPKYVSWKWCVYTWQELCFTPPAV